MKTPLILAVSALALAACGPAADAPSAPVADRPQVPVTSVAGTALPPVTAETPRFVGRWAANGAMCDRPWVFEARRLVTPGEVACTFDRVDPIPGGYGIAATCTAQAPPEPHSLRLTFAESAQAMMVDGGPFSGPIGLVWCGK